MLKSQAERMLETTVKKDFIFRTFFNGLSLQPILPIYFHCSLNEPCQAINSASACHGEIYKWWPYNLLKSNGICKNNLSGFSFLSASIGLFLIKLLLFLLLSLVLLLLLRHMIWEFVNLSIALSLYTGNSLPLEELVLCSLIVLSKLKVA